MKTILVTKCGVYKDGGTEEYRGTNRKRYFIDGRRNSPTKGEIFDRYPGDEGAQILTDIVLAEKVGY